MGLQIGESTPVPNFLNLFYALENGTAKTGEFTLDAPLPSGENLVIETGLSEINGLMVADADWDASNTGYTPEYVVFSVYIKHPARDKEVSVSVNNSVIQSGQYAGFNSASYLFLTRCSYKFDGGSVYVSPDFGSNEIYTPFCKGHRYVWVAW